MQRKKTRDRTNVEIHLNSKISRQLIKCGAHDWHEHARREANLPPSLLSCPPPPLLLSLSLSLSVRGFTHSGGARRIKASPTGRLDKPDQKEYTEREERASSGLQWGARVKESVHPTTSPSHTHTHTHTERERRVLGCTWSTALLRLAPLQLCAL